jgi:hypothetical protein
VKGYCIAQKQKKQTVKNEMAVEELNKKSNQI